MEHEAVDLHNVAERRDFGGRDGTLLQRVPEDVRTELNDGAQSRMRHPAGVEIRFVPDGTASVTLSLAPGGSADEGIVRVFWGPLQSRTEYVIDEEPRTIELAVPEKVRRLDDAAVADLAYDPRVCRVCLPGGHRGGYTLFHGVEGDVRPPTGAELPDRRYLAYGTSITEGEAPLAEHLTYVAQTARRLDADLVNLGSCGSAYCDPAMADYIADRDDWDVATLSISVNMVGPFSPEEFRDRAGAMVETVAAAHPDTPVVPVTLLPNARDVVEDHVEAELSERFREELRAVVAESDRDNVHLVEGPDLLPDVDGLTTDLVHPGDGAMITVGENLAGELRPLLTE